MKARCLSICLASLATAGSLALAGDDKKEVLTPTTAPADPLSEFGLAFKLQNNVRISIKNVGGFTTASNPGPATGSGMDRFYDDGYNRVDISSNHSGQTWFWGYQNSSQVQGDSLALSSSRPLAAPSFDDRETSPGFEIFYRRVIGKIGPMRWGVQGAFDYAPIRNDGRDSGSVGVVRITDAYALGGVIPPPAPYNGTFAGPGTLIGDAPTRTISRAQGGKVTIERSVDVDQFTGDLGVFAEWKPLPKFGISFLGGFDLNYMTGDFDFRETTAVSGVGTQVRSGSKSDDDFIVGARAEIRFKYQITKAWGVFSAAQYQYAGPFQLKSRSRETAELRFDQTANCLIGVGFAF